MIESKKPLKFQSKKLEKQVSKVFGNSDELVFNENKFSNFLSLIEKSYFHYDHLIELSERSLEFSSKELTEANKTLSQLNQSVTAMVDSLGQAFFIFDEKGVCSSIFSKACIELLECYPPGKSVIEIFKIPAEEKDSFLQWVKLLFQDSVDFTDIAQLGPTQFNHSKGKFIAIEYKAIRSIENQTLGVVVVATDKSAEIQAQNEAKEKEVYAEMLVKLFREKNQFVLFLKLAREMFQKIYASILEKDTKKIDLDKIKRLLHTLKGGAATFNLVVIQKLSHEIEEIVPKNHTDPEFRDKLTKIHSKTKELEKELEEFLIEYRDILGQDFENKGYTREIRVSELYHFLNDIKKEKEVGVIFKKFVETIVTEPIEKQLRSYESLVLGVAKRSGKKINPFQITGGQIRILTEKYEQFFSNLVHVFTNAVEHGIETPDQRISKGKNQYGTISVLNQIITENKNQFLLILIEDDGKGISAEKIREALKKKGYPDYILNLPDDQVIQIIFDPGFSTQSEVTELSGRGVGLDALKSTILSMSGSISVHKKDEGTLFKIKLPYLMTEF